MKKRFIYCLVFILIVSISAVSLNSFAATGSNVRGDVNGDRRLTKSDFDLVERYILKCDLSGKTFIIENADYNLDGKIDIFDLLGIALDADDMGTYTPRI